MRIDRERAASIRATVRGGAPTGHTFLQGFVNMSARKKRLVVEDAYVFAATPPVKGARPKEWSVPSSPLGSRFSSDLHYKIKVVGVDVGCGPVKSPVFETELLADGYTTQGQGDALEWAIRAEISRLDGSSSRRVPVSGILQALAPPLRRLYASGYTIEDLRRLAVGTLKVSITDEEVAGIVFG